MTTKDRVLCAFGFHGPLEDTGDKIMKRYSRYGVQIGEAIEVGVIKKCTICNRDVKCK